MAANPDKGELDLTIAGTTYTLVLKTLALITWQRHFAIDGVRPSIESLVQALQAGSIEHAAVLFWAALQKHHPQITLAAAMDLMDDMGGLPASQELITAFSLATPDPEDVRELDQGAARPRRAQPGIGVGSNSTLVAAG